MGGLEWIETKSDEHFDESNFIQPLQWFYTTLLKLRLGKPYREFNFFATFVGLNIPKYSKKLK